MINDQKDKVSSFSYPEEELTHFGYQKIPFSEKASKVKEVFSTVANRYDLMNDFMSVGLHRLWKDQFVAMADLKPNEVVLDLAGGTGDITRRIIERLNQQVEVILCDINYDMISVGRQRLLDLGYAGVKYIQADGEKLPFKDNTFSAVFVAFGLRNMTSMHLVLQEINRVLLPGGRVLILEFSHPESPFLKRIYDKYSFSILPKLGQLFTGSAASYQYLVESIRKHPKQRTLKFMMEEAGFVKVNYCNKMGGIVAIHKANKI